MKNLFYIITFLFLLISSNNVLACGNSSTQITTEQADCNQKKIETKNKSCCDSNDDKQESDCNGKCNNKNCHCPVSVNPPILVYNCEIKPIVLITQSKLKWAFIQNAPKPIYSAIWQPPKIG